MVQKTLKKVLNGKESFELSGDFDMFYIECKNLEHRKILLEGGPIFVGGKIMVIRELENRVKDFKTQISSLPI